MNNPYEKGGIIASVVILVAILSVGMVMMHTPYEYDKASGGSSSGSTDVNHWNVPPVMKHVPEPNHPMSYYYENQAKQKCKALAEDLQQFSDCVNFGFVCVEWDNKLKCSLTSGDDDTP